MYYIFTIHLQIILHYFILMEKLILITEKGKVSIKLILSQIFPFQGLKSLKS